MCFKFIHPPILHIFPIFFSSPHTSLLNLITHNQNTTPSSYYIHPSPNIITFTQHPYLIVISIPISSPISLPNHIHLTNQSHLSPIFLIHCIIYPILPNSTQSYPYLSNINTYIYIPPLPHFYIFIQNQCISIIPTPIFLPLKTTRNFTSHPLK